MKTEMIDPFGILIIPEFKENDIVVYHGQFITNK